MVEKRYMCPYVKVCSLYRTAGDSDRIYNSDAPVIQISTDKMSGEADGCYCQWVRADPTSTEFEEVVDCAFLKMFEKVMFSEI